MGSWSTPLSALSPSDPNVSVVFFMVSVTFFLSPSSSSSYPQRVGRLANCLTRLESLLVFFFFSWLADFELILPAFC